MLRAFFVLLSLITDYDTVSDLWHQAPAVGLANSCVLLLVAFLFVVRRVRHTDKCTEKMAPHGVAQWFFIGVPDGKRRKASIRKLVILVCSERHRSVFVEHNVG